MSFDETVYQLILFQLQPSTAHHDNQNKKPSCC